MHLPKVASWQQPGQARGPKDSGGDTPCGLVRVPGMQERSAKSDSKNKTKYFRLRWFDEVSKQDKVFKALTG